MVVLQHSKVEWSFRTPVDTQPNNVCGRKQYRMGMLLGSSSGSRIFDSRRGSTIHQLARVEGGSSGPQDLSSPGELDGGTHQNRQHNQSILYQQARGNSFSPTHGISYRSMELVSSTQDHDRSAAYSGCP